MEMKSAEGKKVGANKYRQIISETAARKHGEVPELMEKQVGKKNDGSKKGSKEAAEDKYRKEIERYAGREIADWENYYVNG